MSPASLSAIPSPGIILQQIKSGMASNLVSSSMSQLPQLKVKEEAKEEEMKKPKSKLNIKVVARKSMRFREQGNVLIGLGQRPILNS